MNPPITSRVGVGLLSEPYEPLPPMRSPSGVKTTTAYTHICVYIYIYIFIYLFLFMYLFIYIYIYIYTHTYVCVYIYIYIHTHTRLRIRPEGDLGRPPLRQAAGLAEGEDERRPQRGVVTTQ